MVAQATEGGEDGLAPEAELVDRASAVRAARPLLGGRASGVVLIAALLLLWEVSARFLVDSVNWPPVTAILGAFASNSSEIVAVFLASLRLVIAGFAIGAGLGVLFGLATGLSRLARRALWPTLEFLRPLPVPGLVPPLILLLGIDDALKITLVAFATFFPVLINTAQGVRSVDPVLLNTARTFRHGRLRSILSVTLPAAMPFILSGMRISIGLALIVTVVAEMIAGGFGIGSFILTMQYSMNAAEMYAAVFLLAVAGYLLNLSLVLIENRVLHWSRADER